MGRIYLDWAATALPDRDLARKAAELAFGAFGNPSSPHAEGREARKALEAARSLCGRALGGGGQIVFGSGGTESNGAVLSSLLRRKEPVQALISRIEHASVYEAALSLKSLGLPVKFVGSEADGRISPGKVAEMIGSDTSFVAVMAVNNETGAIQPFAEIASACAKRSESRGRKIHVHVDAVQALGKIPFSPFASGIDSASGSGHKIGAPRGIGMLWLRKPLDTLIQGGGQEGGMRSGTENLFGALAFSQALGKSVSGIEAARAKAGSLIDRLLSGLAAIPGAKPVPYDRAPGDARFSPFIACLAFPGLPGETMVRALDDRGIAVSTGSACSSTRKERRVLEAMGLPEEEARSTIRISIGGSTEESDIDAFLQSASEIYTRLMRR